MHVPCSDGIRAEIRQVLLLLAATALVLATLDARMPGLGTLSIDLVLAFCGAWFANQLIRGHATARRQVLHVLEIYFSGLLACAIAIGALGLLVFLPDELAAFGRSLIYATTFTTNLEIAVATDPGAGRFASLLPHLWLPALIAQSCLGLWILYWQLRSRPLLLLGSLPVLGGLSLAISYYPTEATALLPMGGLWAFLCGAAPILGYAKLGMMRHALGVGVLFLTSGLLIVMFGDANALLVRFLIAFGCGLLFLASRPESSTPMAAHLRRKRFAFVVHAFIWSYPTFGVVAGLYDGTEGVGFHAWLAVAATGLSYLSWRLWWRLSGQAVAAVHMFRKPALTMSAVLTLGALLSFTQGVPARLGAGGTAYLDAMRDPSPRVPCSVDRAGVLAGLEVCRLGKLTAPDVLVWGDHLAREALPGLQVAAARSGASMLLVSRPACAPLVGVQFRGAIVEGRALTCEQHNAQVLQAVAHLTSLKMVMLIGDWHMLERGARQPGGIASAVSLAPNDGRPFNPRAQGLYLSEAISGTVEGLLRHGLRVAALRQPPVQPGFHAETAARALTPGHWLYQQQMEVGLSRRREAAQAEEGAAHAALRLAQARGDIGYLDTWPLFCSTTECSVRGGLASYYSAPTRLTRHGALVLGPVIADSLQTLETFSRSRLLAGL